MCLALPAKILEKDGPEGIVRMGDARLKVNLLMTEDADVGDWVLVHAGFAIQQVDETYALETLQLIDSLQPEAVEDAQHGGPGA